MVNLASPWRSTYFFGASDAGPGDRHLTFNADRVHNTTLDSIGQNNKNGGQGTSPQNIEWVLANVGGFTAPKLHEVSNGTLKLRNYPIPNGGPGDGRTWREIFRWDNQNTPTSELYSVGGMICNAPRLVGDRKTLRQQLPFSIRLRLQAHGRGQHLAVWFFNYGGNSNNEIDVSEFVVDNRTPNLPAGLFNAYDFKGPGTSPQVFETPGGSFFIDRWMTFTITEEGSNLVIRRDGVVKYSTSAAAWLDQLMYFKVTYEGGGGPGVDGRQPGGSWPGVYLGDPVPRAQPADPITATPWPAVVEIDHIRFGTL